MPHRLVFIQPINKGQRYHMSSDLDNNLKKMGTRLFVLQGDALTVIKKFCKE